MLIFCSDHFCLIFSLKQSLQCCAAQKQVFLLTSREIKRSLGAGGWSEGTPGCSTARHNILRLQAQAPPRNPTVAAFKNAVVWIRHSSWDIKKMRSFLSAVCSGNGVFLPTNTIDLCPQNITFAPISIKKRESNVWFIVNLGWISCYKLALPYP